MAINFPHPATPDQTHSHNGKTWKWNGTSWNMQSSFTTGGGVNAGGGNVAVGTIALWSGSVSNIPAGWQLCDGTNGSPDLRDKFVIGAGNSYNVGVTGGSKDAIVVQHDHDINDSGHTHRPLSSGNNSTTVMSVEVALDGSTEKYCPAIGSGATVNNASNTTEETTGISIQDEGSSGVNANLPPYYSLCYIYCNTSGGVPIPSYTDSDVDSHLNQDDPTNGYVLSWSGTDYEWVEQSGGISGINVKDDQGGVGGNPQDLGNATSLLFNGDGCTASGLGSDQKTITIPGGIQVQNDGTPLTTTCFALNFRGDGVTASRTDATKWIDIPGYDNADVDAHLNKSSAGNNEVLSWNGTDYDWVAQSSGGGSDYTLEALLSPGVQLVKDGTASATDRVFFNGSGGLSVTRTSTDPWTIEFDASQVTGTIPILDVTNWSSTANDNVGTSKTGTINRAAFEKAIGSLSSTGGIIYVPHGDYQINGTINITNTGTNNVGDGGGIVIMGPNYRVGAADSEGARLIAQDATSDIFKITNVRNVEIKQLAFDSAVTRTGGNAIHCYSNTNTQQIKLERLYIRNQFGGIKMDGHSMSILRDIEMRHFNDIANSYGLIISASEGGTERVDQIRCQNVLIDGEVVGGNSNVGNASNNTVGIQIQDFTNSVWFDHCVANRCTYGMNFHTSMPSGGTGNPGSFFRVSDCDFDTNSHSGINVEGGSFIWVNSPYIGSNKRNGIRTTSNFTGVLRINDADCRGNSEHGIYIASTGHKKIMINNPQCCENGASTWSGTGSGDGIRIVNNANDIQIQGGQCGGDVMGSTGGSTTNNSRQQDTGIRFEGVNGGSHARCTVAFVDCTDNNNDAIDFNTQSGSYNYQVGVAGHGGVANNGQWPT